MHRQGWRTYTHVPKVCQFFPRWPPLKISIFVDYFYLRKPEVVFTSAICQCKWVQYYRKKRKTMKYKDNKTLTKACCRIRHQSSNAYRCKELHLFIQQTWSPRQIAVILRIHYNMWKQFIHSNLWGQIFEVCEKRISLMLVN